MENLNVKLEKLLKSMDLPWNRKKDFTSVKLKWLKKNLAERNKNHKNYIEAESIINKLLKIG